MTKPDFIRCLQTRDRTGRRFMIAGMAIMGFALIAAAVVDSSSNSNIATEGLSKLARGLLLSGVIGGILCVIVGGAVNSGVQCAKCGKRLFQFSAQIAVATGNCGYCGEKAFDEVHGAEGGGKNK